MAHRDGSRDRADRVRHRARHYDSRRQTRAPPRSAGEGPRAGPAPGRGGPLAATLKCTPGNKNRRTAVVSVSGYGIDYFTVNGASQPSLWDQDGRLPALTRKLIGS
jgi:hypothetical protein